MTGGPHADREPGRELPAAGDLRAVIAQRLVAARELAGLSQGQAARLLKMHRPTVSEIEAGRRRVAAEELTAFARLYAVSLAWLAAEDVGSTDAAAAGAATAGAPATAARAPLTPEVELAARELEKLSGADRERVLALVSTLRLRPAAPASSGGMPSGEAPPTPGPPGAVGRSERARGRAPEDAR